MAIPRKKSPFPGKYPEDLESFDCCPRLQEAMYSARSLLIGVSFLDFKFFRDIAWPLFERRSQGSC